MLKHLTLLSYSPKLRTSRCGLLCLSILLLVSGCYFGDAALPIVSTTPVPDSGYEVHLGGPDRMGSFGYYITSQSSRNYGYRTLGPLRPDQMTPATIERLDDGVYRIQWGSTSDAAFAVIDFKQGRYVEDSNLSNPSNQPFARE